MSIVIGYVRRSTDKQEMSLEQQRNKLRQFATARGLRLAEVFEDDAISGSDMSRPGLERLLAHAKQSPEVVAVIVWERNRLARPKDPLDGLMLERELLSAGKRVLYAATGQEADRSFMSGLIGYIEHHQSGDYLRKLSRDTVRGLVHRVQQGYWPGGPIPFGYDRVVVSPNGAPRRIVRDMPDRSQLVIDPTTGRELERVNDGHRYSKQDFELCSLTPSEPARVRAVQKLFADYAAGSPIRVLRDDLNRSGLRTSRGRSFTPATIHAILDNPAYTGRCVYNRRTESKWHRITGGGSVERLDEGLERRPESDWIVKADAWPALVDAATFERVAARRQASKKSHRHVTGRAVDAGYLLSGLIFCGVCGGRLSGQTTTSGKGYKTRYYVCSTHHRGEHHLCPKRYTVPAVAVEEHIIGLIREDLGQLRNDRVMHGYIAEQMARLKDGATDSRDQLQRRVAELDQQSATLRDHFKSLAPAAAAGLGLYQEAERIAEERQQVERNLSLLGPGLPELPDAATIQANASAAFDQLEAVVAGGTLEEKRELIGLYVEAVKADPDAFCVQIGLYSALFKRVMAGEGFEPTTFGL